MESSDGDEDGMLFLLRNLVTLEDLWNPWKPKLAGIIVILYMVIENKSSLENIKESCGLLKTEVNWDNWITFIG